MQQGAKANGRNINELVKNIVEDQALTLTLDELFTPARREIAEKGITEDDLDEFECALRRKVKAEKGSAEASDLSALGSAL